MPFRAPRRLPKRFPLSRFKNVLETDDFRLQKRRQRTFGTHKYRIILVVPRAGVVTRLTGRKLPVYEIAHGDDLEELRSREWNFLLNSVAREMPEKLVPGTHERFHWILSYLTQLLLEMDHTSASSSYRRPALSLQEVDDGMYGVDAYSSDEEEVGETRHQGYADADNTSSRNGIVTPRDGYGSGTGSPGGGATQTSYTEDGRRGASGAMRKSQRDADSLDSDEEVEVRRSDDNVPFGDSSRTDNRPGKSDDDVAYLHREVEKWEERTLTDMRGAGRGESASSSKTSRSPATPPVGSNRALRIQQFQQRREPRYKHSRSNKAHKMRQRKRLHSSRRKDSNSRRHSSRKKRFQKNNSSNSRIKMRSPNSIPTYTSKHSIRSSKGYVEPTDRNTRSQYDGIHPTTLGSQDQALHHSMRIAIKRRDNILIMICLNAALWWLRSNSFRSVVEPFHFYIALCAANLFLLSVYLRRYCRLSKSFSDSSLITMLKNFETRVAIGDDKSGARGDAKGERGDFSDDTYEEQDDVNVLVSGNENEDDDDEVDDYHLSLEEDDDPKHKGRRSSLNGQNLEAELPDRYDERIRNVTMDSDGKIILGDSIPKSKSNDMTNCWTPIDGRAFRLRTGPNYPRNKKKDFSLHALYTVETFDIFRSGQKHRHLYQHCSHPSGISDRAGISGIPLTFVVSVMLPDCTPSNPLWGNDTMDGATNMMLITGKLRPEYLEALETLEALKIELSSADATAAEKADIQDKINAGEKKLPSSVDLLRRFVAESLGDKRMGDRFKLVANIKNIDESDLDSWSKSILRRYNAKPLLTRPQHEFFAGPGLSYFEVWIDVHQFAFFARRVLNGIQDVLTSMNTDLGFCIEAHSDDEQPEQTLMCLGTRKIGRLCENILDWPHGKKHPDYAASNWLGRSGMLATNSVSQQYPFSDAEEKIIY